MANSVDERLLSGKILNQNQEGEAARELREKKRGAAGAENGAEAGAGGESGSLRERIMQARAAMNLKELAKKKIAEKITAPAKAGTSKLLQQAWINLPDSFGLTLIWINLHVFLKWVLGEKLFCKLGEEWLPKEVTAAGGDAAKTAGKGFGLIETIVLLILDFIILAVILGILALIVIMVDFMTKSWWEKLEVLVNSWKTFYDLGWGGISALVNLFVNAK